VTYPVLKGWGAWMENQSTVQEGETTGRERSRSQWQRPDPEDAGRHQAGTSGRPSSVNIESKTDQAAASPTS